MHDLAGVVGGFMARYGILGVILRVHVSSVCDSLGFAILSPTVCGMGIIRVENRYGTFCGFKNRELVVV